MIANPPAYDERCEWCRRGTEHNGPAHYAAMRNGLAKALTPQHHDVYAPWEKLGRMAQEASDRLRVRAAKDATMGALLNETERRAVERYHVSIWEAELIWPEMDPQDNYSGQLRLIESMYIGPFQNRGER